MASDSVDLRSGGVDVRSSRVLHHGNRTVQSCFMGASTIYGHFNQQCDSRYNIVCSRPCLYIYGSN